MIHGPHRLSAALALAFAELPAEEREQMERVKEAVCANPIMVVPTDPQTEARLEVELNHTLGNHKSPAEIVSDVQNLLLIKPQRLLTEVIAPWEYEMRQQTKPRSKRGQRGRKWT